MTYLSSPNERWRVLNSLSPFVFSQREHVTSVTGTPEHVEHSMSLKSMFLVWILYRISMSTRSVKLTLVVPGLALTSLLVFLQREHLIVGGMFTRISLVEFVSYCTRCYMEVI